MNDPLVTTRSRDDSAGRRRTPRWGHLSRSVGRYGCVSTRLVVYPPTATTSELLWAEVSRLYLPLALGGAVIAWLVLSAAGLPVATAGIAVVLALAPIGVALSVRALPITRASATSWSHRSGLHEDPAESEEEDRVERYARTLQHASEEYRRGRLSLSEFHDRWSDVYDAISSRRDPSR